MCDQIQIAGLVNDSITDGPGLRFAVFVQGCSRRCPGCHNPDALPFTGGRAMTAAEILQQIDANPLLTGVTFSGGEPFAQAAALLALAKGIADRKLELAIYTGYTFEELLALPDPSVLALLRLCQVLIDGPFIQAKRNLDIKFKGSANQRILDAPQSLLQGGAVPEAQDRWQ